MASTSPLALLEHENCRFHRRQKLRENRTFINRIFYDSRNANGVPKVDLGAPKWSKNSTKTHRADSAPTANLRKDTPGARSRHSGRVGRWKFARSKAEIERDNIRKFRNVSRKQHGWFFGFCTLRWRRPAAAHTDPNQPYKKSKSQWECRKVLISGFAIAKSKVGLKTVPNGCADRVRDGLISLYTLWKQLPKCPN